MTRPHASLVVPAKNEEEAILPLLRRIDEAVTVPVEVIIVVDAPTDRTLIPLQEPNHFKHAVRHLVSKEEPGPAGAIKSGINSAQSRVVVITMADGSDDPGNIDALINLVEQGYVIAAASRYMPGGQQIGGPKLKKFLSKNASRTLMWLVGLGIHDATNSFKAYSLSFLEEVGIESRHGFEMGLELTAKAHRRKYLISEVPTVWTDRTVGKSNFQLKRWLPHYLRWFVFALGIDLLEERIRKWKRF